MQGCVVCCTSHTNNPSYKRKEALARCRWHERFLRPSAVRPMFRQAFRKSVHVRLRCAFRVPAVCGSPLFSRAGHGRHQSTTSPKLRLSSHLPRAAAAAAAAAA
ncbi:hypothetical protein E2C01_049619 [Portunus trituberculatus]|uniref:Uncharacterized protein n=1 Tax=Portunus trituberculatus TaxID=210409 RepID=A0A5B7GDN6_PORTR|nr:hypothetical protein [Portunus trituberculatus]